MKKNKETDSFIGKKIRELRKRHNLTQSKLAGLMGVSHQQVQQYEIGQTRVSAATIFEVSQIFNVSPNYFYDGLEEQEAIKNSAAQDGLICTNRNKPLKILIVEDSHGEELLMREAIEEASDNVIINSTQDGEEAFEYLKNCSDKYHDDKRPDLVLLDLNLPKKDGIDVLKFIKKNEKLRDIQVIVTTNSINPQDMYDTYNMFAAGYIKKSADYKEFSETIKRLVDFWEVVITPAMQYE